MNQALYHAIGLLGQSDNPTAADLFALVGKGATLVDATDIFHKVMWEPDFPAVVLRPWYQDLGDGAYGLQGVKPAFSSALFFVRPFGKAFSYVWYVADNGGEVGIGESLVILGDIGATLVSEIVLTDNPTTENEWLGTWASATAQATYALASARNARWVEATPNRATRRRNTTAPGVRFRSVVIDMEHQKSRSVASSGDGQTPWHKRRGHWKHYERPRFGREGEVGWFWVSETEVGERKHGIIVQDYTVKPPAP